jgi:hypothetical protein
VEGVDQVTRWTAYGSVVWEDEGQGDGEIIVNVGPSDATAEVTAQRIAALLSEPVRRSTLTHEQLKTSERPVKCDSCGNWRGVGGGSSNHNPGCPEIQLEQQAALVPDLCAVVRMKTHWIRSYAGEKWWMKGSVAVRPVTPGEIAALAYVDQYADHKERT